MKDNRRFLDSDVPAEPRFEALGHTGSGHYAGLETFDNPGCLQVTLQFDELVGKCPVTGQPDFYAGRIVLRGTEKLIESKSLKLFFQGIIESTLMPGQGIFGESLCVYIRDQIAEALDEDTDKVMVELTQKSRGGISIVALA